VEPRVCLWDIQFIIPTTFIECLTLFLIKNIEQGREILLDQASIALFNIVTKKIKLINKGSLVDL
jgi:hypothetical protein